MAREKTETKTKTGAAAEPPAKPNRRGKLPLIVLGVTLLLAASGGAGWYFLDAPAEDKSTAGRHAPAAKPKEERAKPAVFVPLEVFTVNLQPEGGDHLLQTTLSLKVSESSVEQAIKLQMPEVRSRLLLLLSSKRPSEVATVEGKQELANQIAAEVNVTLNPASAKKPAPKPAGPVLSVFFTTFIIQRS